MKSCRFLALFVLLLGVAAQPAFASSLQPFEARYDVLRNGSKLGVSTLTLAPEGDGWNYTSRTAGTDGLAAIAAVEIVEVSRFRWVDDRIELVESRYDQKAAWKKRSRHIVCDAAAGTISSTDKDRTTSLVFEPNVIDRHLSVLALASDLSAQRAAPLSYRVAHKAEVKTDRYDVIGAETVDVPAGRFEATKLELARENRGRTTTVWAAESLGFLPARILQREPDGETIELRLVTAPRR